MVSLARKNLFHDRLRFAITVSGVAFAVTLVLVQVGLFISPVGFSSTIVPEEWRLLYSLNPMVGVIDGFRWAVLGVDVPLYWPGTLLSLVLISLLLVTGVTYFRRTERTFVDVI